MYIFKIIFFFLVFISTILLFGFSGSNNIVIYSDKLSKSHLNYNSNIDYGQNINNNLLNPDLFDTIDKLSNILDYNNFSALDYIFQTSKNENIDPYFVISVIAQESKGNHLELNYNGKAGLMQLDKKIAKLFNLNVPHYDSKLQCCYSKKDKTISTKCDPINDCNIESDNRFDPFLNIETGIKNIKSIIKNKNVNTVEDVIISYNCGTESIKNVKKNKDDKYLDVQQYAKNIKKFYEDIYNHIDIDYELDVFNQNLKIFDNTHSYKFLFILILIIFFIEKIIIG